MGADVQFARATPAHAEELARVIRAEDVAELQACGCDDVLATLMHGLETSDPALALLFNGEVAMLLGVQPVRRGTALGGADAGIVWFLTGRAVSRHPKAFLQAAPVLRRFLLERFELLTNVVDARYAAAVRFVRWLGAEVSPARPFGPYGLPFHFATLRRSAWADQR